MVGVLACILYLFIHIGASTIYNAVKHKHKGENKGTKDSSFQRRQKSRPHESKKDREHREAGWQAEHGVLPKEDFDYVLQKASEKLGYSKLKAKRWIREQKKKGEDKYYQEHKDAKKIDSDESVTKKAQSWIDEQTSKGEGAFARLEENAKQRASDMEDKAAECCKKSEKAIGKASRWAQQASDSLYGTIEVSSP